MSGDAGSTSAGDSRGSGDDSATSAGHTTTSETDSGKVETGAQEFRSETSALERRVHAGQCQVVVRVGRLVGVHLLERGIDGCPSGLPGTRMQQLDYRVLVG